MEKDLKIREQFTVTIVRLNGSFNNFDVNINILYVTWHSLLFTLNNNNNNNNNNNIKKFIFIKKKKGGG